MVLSSPPIPINPPLNLPRASSAGDLGQHVTLPQPQPLTHTSPQHQSPPHQSPPHMNPQFHPSQLNSHVQPMSHLQQPGLSGQFHQPPKRYNGPSVYPIFTFFHLCFFRLFPYFYFLSTLLFFTCFFHLILFF